MARKKKNQNQKAKSKLPPKKVEEEEYPTTDSDWERLPQNYVSSSSSSSESSSSSDSESDHDEIKVELVDEKKPTARNASDEGLFQPFCALGLVTDGLHLSGHTHDQKYFLTLSADSHVDVLLNTNRLTTILGPTTRTQDFQKLTAVCRRCPRTVFMARGAVIELWDHSESSHSLLKIHEHSSTVIGMCYFGTVLVSLSDDGSLVTWDVDAIQEDQESDFRYLRFASAPINVSKYGKIKLAEMGIENPTCLFHPATYINKVLIGGENSSVLLININSQKLIYRFNFNHGALIAIAQSPVPDVCAFSFSDGSVVIHNVKLDTTLFTFQESLSVAMSLAFRNDGVPMLASGNGNGFISVWDLEKRRLIFNYKAHSAAVTQLLFTPDTNFLYSIGRDNALKHWIFDLPEGKCRLTSNRAGHFGPISALSVFPLETYEGIVTGSVDQDLRYFPMPSHGNIFGGTDYSRNFSYATKLTKISKNQHKELSDLKAPPVVSLDLSQTRMKDWGSVVSIHEKHPYAYIWHYTKYTLLQKVSSCEQPPTPITAACISACGNYVVIGTMRGHVERINIQSGRSSGVYIDPSLRSKVAHKDTVKAIQIDMLNKYLVTGSSQNTLKMWNFGKQELIGKIKLPGGVIGMELFRDNNLLAVSTSDNSMSVFDMTTQKLIRQFSAQASISCFTFSPDGRWLVVCSTDTVIQVYDIPSAKVIDWFRLELPVSCVKFLPKGDYLVTTFAGYNYFHLWANRTFWNRVFYRALPVTAPLLYSTNAATILDSLEENEGHQAKLVVEKNETGTGLKRAKGEKHESKPSKVSTSNEQEAPQNSEALEHQILEGSWHRDNSTEPLDFYLYTKSILPKSKWLNIHNLDTIKKRNKPLEPPKKGQLAPFFLELIEDLNPHFNKPAQLAENPDQPETVASRLTPNISSAFSIALLEGQETGNYGKAFDVLKDMNPSGIDYEISSIPTTHLHLFLNLIKNELENHKNFELLNAYLSLFVRRHGEFLAKEASLSLQVDELAQKLRRAWANLEEEFQTSLCLIKYFSGIQF